jgi:hypothetical protein
MLCTLSFTWKDFQLLHVHGKVRSDFVIGNSVYKLKQKNCKYAFILYT